MAKEEKLEQELLELIQRNDDEKLFRLLFRLYYSKLCSYAMIFVKASDLAEEIVQETFIKLWENKATLKINRSLKAYLFRCVHNNCINYLTKNEVMKRQYKQIAEEITYHNQLALQNFRTDIIDQLVSEETERKITYLLDILPPQSRRIFFLSRFEGLSYQQIATELNLSVETVRTQIKRAIKKMKEIL